MSITIISPLNPFTAWAPLLIVIGILMTREGYEDFQRYKADRKLNFKSFARVIRSGAEHDEKWS
jgi:4-hydroxybenzoate polyprenyltransferase